ncbi:MBL fold metallo-hydrolase [Paracoccus sp. ME4]|uniref:MBL fold metallo-hydrolase n=1 Tax=Paracoccus sp. ME4 TaxID=3138066 RepID=UPI00398B5D6B
MPELRALSGIGVKGPACFLLSIDGRSLLLDLGRGPDGARLPDLSGLPRIDAVLISHGHVDHTGGLDQWQALGAPPLYAPRPSIALAQEGPLTQATPLDGRDEILGLPLLTGAAGHAPGAVWMRIGGAEGLLYSGDVSRESLLYRNDPLPRAAALILDCAYGTADEPLTAQIAAIEALADQPLLLPCPAGGRGLEIAAHFLAAGHSVRICPAHRRVARTLVDHRAWLTPEGRKMLDSLDRAGDLDATGPLDGIMVAAGPNAERGTAQPLAARIAASGGARIVLTGHVAEGSPGAALLAAGKALFRRWNVHPTLAQAEALVAQVAPRTMLAAFCGTDALADLRDRTTWPLAPGERLVW